MLYEVSTLANGLRVVTSTMPHTRAASLLVYYKVGSRYEPAPLSGISHYIEHMLFKGTHKRPEPQEISEAIEGVGGSLNAVTDREYTAYTAQVPARHFERALDVVTDMITNSRFAEDEVERERSVITEEINGVLDSPPDIVNELIDSLIWGDQPIGRPVAGTRETVGAITRAQMLEWLQSHYLPQNCVVTVAGNIEHAQVVGAVQATLGAAGDGRAAPDYPAAAVGQDAPRLGLATKDTEQTHLCVGLPALSYVDPDRYVQQMLDGILGGGMSSRLFVEIREKRALAYSVASYVDSLHDTGGFIVYAGVDNDRVTHCVRAVMHELDRMRQAPPPVDELNKVKEYYKGHLVLGLEGSRSVAGWGGRQVLLLDEIDTVDEVMERIDAVTPAAVQDLAQRLFRDDQLSLGLVGPFEETEAFRELLTIR